MGNRTSYACFFPRRLATAVTALALMSLTACTSPRGQSPDPSLASSSAQAPSKILTVAATVEPATLDMTLSDPVASAQVQLYNVYETLVKIDGDGVLQPLLAQRWSVSPDRTTYTFFLNPAAKFASGAAVSADAVIKNIERIKSGASVATKYSRPMSLVASQKAIDATTVQITLTKPSNTWLYSMGDTAGMIADPAGFASLGTATAGSGPYTLDRWARGDSITLKKNANYWANPGRFDAVVFKYFQDPNAMNAAMLGGTIDIISNEQAPDSLTQFADAGKYTILEGTTNSEVTMGLNNANPALKDLKVRRAIAMAIDKKRLLTNVQAGHGTVIGTMTVPSDPYYEDLSGINAYNPTLAKSLLAEAGYASGLTLRLKPAGIPYAVACAQQIAADLKAVGVAVIIEELQFPATWYDTVIKKGDYDMTIVGHAEARDLVTYTNPNYYWHYSNPAFTAQYQAADGAPADAYASEMKKAARILAEDAASVWLYVMPNLVVTKANVTGLNHDQITDSFDVTTIAIR